jgi:hypothetical protein
MAMHDDLQSSFLWEDMSEVQSRLEKALATLQALQRAIQEGRINQPTRQDSKRLNRLVVLAELLYSETRPWIEEHIEVLPPGKNGQHPSPAPAP